ncbi:hypothetical protein E2C01_095918 [Portunus trituberculatus]|uniref:Uncharacterized protein n=1 Tax=Portunus trituberculatus TaxID=210409 RepID=A0A5B7K6W1_PORTR|nr:hypothetical protein [Portunus trituberculatus]
MLKRDTQTRAVVASPPPRPLYDASTCHHASPRPYTHLLDLHNHINSSTIKPHALKQQINESGVVK